MFFIPGILISIVTFPGVIVHELSHQLFCYLRRVPVYEVKYFQFESPNGYVLYEPPDSPITTLVISVGPFFLNTLLGALILLPISIEMIEFGVVASIANGTASGAVIFRVLPTLIAFWLGISILMHAFPSVGDAKVLVSSILKNRDVNLGLRILVAPVIGLIYLGALGSYVWLDLGYAMLISFALPKLIGLLL